MVLKQGDKVKVEYEGKLEDGAVFDSSERHGQPLEFEIGAKQVLPGFEDNVKKMKKGEEKEIKLNAEEAYGERNPQLVQKVPKEKLPEGVEPKSGMMLALNSPDGRQMPAVVTSVTESDITIDLNHPLAGKNLIFDIKLVDVS